MQQNIVKTKKILGVVILAVVVLNTFIYYCTLVRATHQNHYLYEYYFIIHHISSSGWGSLTKKKQKIKMMPLDHPELTEYTLEGVKSYAADGARDVLIVMSSVSEGDYVVPRKSGELTKRDKEKLASEGIPDRSWDNDADLMKERYRKDRKSESVVVAEHCHLKKSVIAKISSTLNNTTKPVGENT